MNPLKVDLALVQKYNVPGPRYTSYPPATFFTEKIQWRDLTPEVLNNNRTERDLSLYFHIPFCYSLCWYCGCHTVITRKQGQSAVYLDYLQKELAHMATFLNPRRKVVQMHLGGGSPTFMTPAEIRTLGGLIRRHFQISERVEAGVEIDPRRMNRDHVTALREAGFNRASVGIQDFDPRVQKAVHRIQPRQMTEQVIGWLREARFESLNVDLIYGLPYQTVASFDRTLDQVLELAPDRFAVFSYAHVPWVKPSQKILETTAALPSAEVKLELLKLITEKLTGTGQYVYIGMDHFARTTDELVRAQRQKTLQRNFQGYSTHGEADIYAFGISAISQTPNAYWQNQKDLTAYYAALDAGTSPVTKGYLLTPDDKLRRVTIMRLMCDLGLDYSYMSRLLGIDFPDYFARELDSLGDLEADGLVRKAAAGLEVTQTGRLFIRNIAMRFDAHLPSQTERRYSRTI